MSEMVDVLVIGGGMAGVSAASELSGEARTLVLEREDAPGYHSTGRSAAVFIANYGNAVLRALNAASAPHLADPGEIADTPLVSPRGEMIVASEAEIAAFEAYLTGASGIAEIAPAEAVAHFPLLREDRIARAAYEADAADIDVARMLQGHARRLRRNGGRVVTGAEVRAIARRDGLWHAETSAGHFAAPVLVNAAGAWADAVAALAGVSPVGLTPYRRTAALIPMERDMARWPVVVSASESWYAKPEAGQLMVSPADEDPVDPHDAWVDDLVLAEGVERFERMTTVEVTRIAHRWAGLRTFAPDRTPVVGFDPRAEGFVWLAGQGGYGIQTAPALARLTADLVLGRASELSAAIVAALSPGRSMAPSAGA